MKMVMESSSSSTATTNATSNQSSNAASINASPANTAGNNYQSNSQFNPQSLGREFVRQYYTVLNEGPHIMHRFYSDDSSLVHGGSNRQGESTVYGQAEINNKMMSLNFKDCHTKIRQVDSMETVGKGVVIQVIGELSNNGEPMRRFFQTFVLAPRSPSNYYVRNDIFRYQDEVFSEEDEYADDVEKSDELDKLNNEPKGHEKSETVVTSISLEDNVYEAVSVNVNGNVSHSEIPEVEKAESDVEVGSKSDHSPYAASNEWETTNARRDEATNEVASVSDGNSTPPPQSQNEPLSYASMVNKNFYNPPPFSNSSSNFVAKPNDASGLLSAPFAKCVVENASAPVSLPPVSSQTTGSNPASGGGVGKPPVSGHAREQKIGRARGHQGAKQRNDSREVTPAYGDNDSSAGEQNDFAVGRRQQFSDEQQVFVGNLLQDITEEQLKNFFGKFGNIVDVRINRANQKSGRTPNYGFVTFDDASVVRNILNQKPIYFNEHRFNVEEKRSQTVRGGGERPGREGSRSGGGGHGSSAGRAVNNVGNTGNRLPPGNGPRRERSDRGNQSYGGNDSGRIDSNLMFTTVSKSKKPFMTSNICRKKI